MPKPRKTPPNIHVRTLANGEVRYFVRFKFNGREFKYPSVTTLKQAKVLLEEERSRLRGNPRLIAPKGHTLLLDVIKNYLSKVQHNKSFNDDLRYAEFWNDYFFKRTVESILIEEIEEARDNLLKSGRFKKRAPSTVNRHAAFLRKVFNEHSRKMVYKGANFPNPFMVLKPFKEAPPKENHILEEEEAKIKEHLSPKDIQALDLAILTGLRQGEQFKLQWPQVEFNRERILLRHPKSGKLESVHLNSDALELLREIEAACPSKKYVFPHPVIPNQPASARGFYERFIKAVEAAGFQERGLVWHSARDTFASRLLETGANLYDVGELGRWSDVANIIKRYGHLSQYHLRSVVERLSTSKSLKKRGATGGPQGKSQKPRLRTVKNKN